MDYFKSTVVQSIDKTNFETQLKTEYNYLNQMGYDIEVHYKPVFDTTRGTTIYSALLIGRWIKYGNT